MNLPSSIKTAIQSETIVINGRKYSQNEGYCVSKKYLEYRNKLKIDEEERIGARELVKVITLNYFETINYNYKKIELIYGKLYNFTDEKIINFNLNIKQISNKYNKELNEMVNELKSYLGYNFSLKRFESIGNGYRKLVPIEPERIAQAWQMIKTKQSFLKIEDILLL